MNVTHFNFPFIHQHMQTLPTNLKAINVDAAHRNGFQSNTGSCKLSINIPAPFTAPLCPPPPTITLLRRRLSLLRLCGNGGRNGGSGTKTAGDAATIGTSLCCGVDCAEGSNNAASSRRPVGSGSRLTAWLEGSHGSSKLGRPATPSKRRSGILKKPLASAVSSNTGACKISMCHNNQFFGSRSE